MPSPTDAPKVRVGVSAFILKSTQEPRNNPRFLIGERINAHGAGTWALPGGHLEFGETPEVCAAREVEEETGLKVKGVRFLTATNDYMPSDNKHYVTMVTVCERQDERAEPQLLEPDKCRAWEWVSWEDLLRWAEQQRDAKGKGGEVIVEKKLFTPLLSLIEQRPGFLPVNV